MRQLSLLVATIVAFFIFLSVFLMSQTSSIRHSALKDPEPFLSEEELATQASRVSLDSMETGIVHVQNPVSPALTQGHVIMPHLGNETIKEELGRASWKLFHTILARFPEHPTLDEREALKGYIHLFARLYPCGECAEHFQALLASHPPQSSSRETASQWGCHIHNKVNESLNKKIFDCSSIAEVYKCGCEEEDEKKRIAEANGKEETQKNKPVEAKSNLQFEKDGLTRGG